VFSFALEYMDKIRGERMNKQQWERRVREGKIDQDIKRALEITKKQYAEAYKNLRER